MALETDSSAAEVAAAVAAAAVTVAVVVGAGEEGVAGADVTGTEGGGALLADILQDDERLWPEPVTLGVAGTEGPGVVGRPQDDVRLWRGVNWPETAAALVWAGVREGSSERPLLGQAASSSGAATLHCTHRVAMAGLGGRSSKIVCAAARPRMVRGVSASNCNPARGKMAACEQRLYWPAAGPGWTSTMCSANRSKLTGVATSFLPRKTQVVAGVAATRGSTSTEESSGMATSKGRTVDWWNSSSERKYCA